MENDYWRLGPNGHEPRDAIVCHNCGHNMVLRWSTVFVPTDAVSALRKVIKEEGWKKAETLEVLHKKGHAEDQEWKCPHCQCTKLFGIPLSEEEFSKLIKTRKYRTWVPIKKWMEDEEVKQKLLDMGYM